MKRVIFAGPWWHEDLMQGVARHSAAQGWHLNLEPALSGELPMDWSGDGILTTLGGDVDQFERFWRQADCPAVSLSLNQPQFDIPRVGFDNAAAGRLAGEHLLERGFASFAFYDRAGQHSGRRRLEAFTQTITAAGHDPPTILAAAQRGEPRLHERWADRQRALAGSLEAVAKPVAVFAADDAGGVEVIEACQTLGLNIPHQVGVLGMLDFPLFRQSTTIPLSSITVDFDRNTQVACELLASLMEGNAPPRRPILFEPTGIAVRASTDVIAARHPAVARAVAFMMQHYDQPIDIPRIVAAGGTSQTRLFIAFKNDIGQSPSSLLTRIRLDKARRLLEQTDQTVEAVAKNCGFGDRRSLYRHFNKHVGQSPGDYRRQSRAQ